MSEHEQPPDSGRNGPDGCYANHFNVGHNAFEFVIDFGQFYEGQSQARMHTRIITAPVYAKQLLRIFTDSMEDFERVYGKLDGDN